MEATAYLVNESRARRPELSRDPLAPAWIPEALRPSVRDLWEGYADTVYPHDDLVVSLRGRAVLDAVERATRGATPPVLVSLGAGFTSYPWLAPVAAALEIDLAGIVDAKSRREAELREAGRLAATPVERGVVDLGADGADDHVLELARDVAGDRPVALVIEGLLYYLDDAAAEALLSLPHRLGGSLAAAAVSFWPTGTEANAVLERQRAWFVERGVSPQASHQSTDRIAAALGPGARIQGPEDLQRGAGLPEVVPEHHLVPEYVATVVR